MSVNYSEIARKTLVDHLGDTGEDIYSRVIIKKPLSEKSSVGEVSDFIKTVEHIVSTISGQDKANEISLTLRSKVQEPAKQTVKKEKVENQNTELEDFHKKHVLPTETDIIDFAKYLTMRYGGNPKQLEIEITVKARNNLKNTISMKRINEEIVAFLGKFSNPEKKDCDDFISYVRIWNIDYPDDEIRKKIEKTRLLQKFHEQKAPQEKPSELDKFMDYMRSSTDKDALIKLLQKEGFGYLIKDEKGVSDKYFNEFIQIFNPGEIDNK